MGETSTIHVHAQPSASRKDKLFVAESIESIVTKHMPVHVTLRVLDAVGKLRRRDAFQIVRGVMRERMGRDDFRIVDLSIQGNHIHLICEAACRQALSSGMSSFKIAVARRINRIRRRNGHVFADRYHDEILRTPRQVRNTAQLAARDRLEEVESD